MITIYFVMGNNRESRVCVRDTYITVCDDEIKKSPMLFYNRNTTTRTVYIQRIVFMLFMVWYGMV